MTTKVHKSHLVLLKLIEKEGNTICADCELPGTRWASWNLGIFLCIRCAGIHRNLGVHISKVKSVDLDSWTKEQMQAIESMGNKKSKKIYEAALPDIYLRPQTNYAVEEFIRAKYLYKRYCLSANSSTNLSENDPNDLTISKSMDQQLCQDVTTFYDYKESERKDESDDDDSLSDPEYIVQQRKVKKNSKKIKNKDIINSVITNNNCNVEQIKNFSDNHDFVNNAVRPYHDQLHVNESYQTPAYDNSSGNRRSYGSSSDSGFYSTTNIPEYGHASYLRQIQDKLTRLKVNLSSKFSQYEEPSDEPPLESHVDPSRSNNSVLSRSSSQRTGQTLSPDLWR